MEGALRARPLSLAGEGQRMREQVQVLLNLRHLDDAVQRLRRRMVAGEADVQRKRLEADLVREVLAREKAKLKDAQSRGREADLEMRTFRERKEHFEKQLHDIKTNVQYDALLREIAAMEKKTGAWETVVLESMEEEEGAQRNIARVEQDYREKEGAAAAEIARFEGVRRQAGAEAQELNGRRASLIQELSGAVRDRYERLSGAKSDSVIVGVQDGSCGGCHYSLPPQTVNEVRKGERMVLCEACGRILVWTEDGAPAGQ
jgi:predicted  nucleic acid-binding Zn-ribbon protein